MYHFPRDHASGRLGRPISRIRVEGAKEIELRRQEEEQNGHTSSRRRVFDVPGMKDSSVTFPNTYRSFHDSP